MAKIKISINKENCLSCGSCFAAQPELFEMDADGKAAVVAIFRDAEITDPGLIEKARAAQALCPNNAIIIEVLPE